MDLEAVEILTVVAGEASAGQHWSRNAAQPRYSLSADEVKDTRLTPRFTCFDVAERVDAEYEVLFAGRVSFAGLLPS